MKWWFKNKVLYWLKQLLPMTYLSHYHDSDGRARFAVWRMWLGRVYASEDYQVIR